MELKAESSIYALTTYKKKLHLLSSIGLIPNMEKPTKQKIVPQMKYELGLMYLGESFNLSLLNERVGKMNRSKFELKKGIGKTPFEITYDVINTNFSNQDLKKMIPEWQQRLSAAYNCKSGLNMNIGVTKEGENTVISFDAKIPFAVIGDFLNF